MKSLNIFSILVTVLFLQGCLPDSFTKFEEEPAVNAEGASGSSGPCPPDSQLSDPFCLSPTKIEYIEDFVFNINQDLFDLADSLDDTDEEPVEIFPRVTGAPIAEYSEFMTFTITPPLPSSTGLSFNVEDGSIKGFPQTFYNAQHTISAEYTGNTPVSLTDPSQVAVVDISIATDLKPNLSFENPLDKTLVLSVDDVTPFLGRSWASAEGNNGAAEILFVDEISNQLHLNSNNVGSDGRFILRLQNELGIDNKEGFSSSKTTSSGVTIAMLPGETLSVDDGPLSTAIFTTPLGELTTIQQDELESISYNISPSLPLGTGLIFTEETTCYDLAGPTEVSRSLCDSGVANHQLVLGGTIWGDIVSSAQLPPTEYTITASNIHGSTAERDISLSILSPAAPKSFNEVAYKQQSGQKLKIELQDASAFENANKISISEGKSATIEGVDLDANQVYVTVDNEDEINFKVDDAVDNSASFFNTESIIVSRPTYFYDDNPVNNAVQPFLLNQISPAGIFESTSLPDIQETRSLQFSISPNIELLGVNFQAQSGCYDVSADPTDPATWVEQLDGSSNPDFTDCDAGTANFLEIRGGTVWGEFSDDVLPVDETEYTVTVESLTGISLEAPFKMEVTPAQEEAEFSYSQDLLLVLQNQSSPRFAAGDFISNNFGASGIVKEVFSQDNKLFIWANVNGPFSNDQNVDNLAEYEKQSGYVEQVHQINAKFTLDSSLPGAFGDIVIDGNDQNNIITNASGANASRLVYKNGNDIYVRVTQGTFTTGQELEDEDGNSLGANITNINAQHLSLSLGSTINSPDIDSTLVYSNNGSGDSYLGTMSVRSVGSTPTTSDLEVEMVKGELGTTQTLFLENPYTGASPSTTVSSISTNLTRFTGMKNMPLRIAPVIEPGFEVKEYTIEPELPLGLTLDAETGVISGTPIDRSDFIEYTVTISNQFDNPSYQPETYTFNLEVKDYFGIFNATNTNYILHQSGMGNGRSPCMVTRQQLESGQAGSRDIQCFLEAGEGELHREGLSLNIEVGNDMCRFVSTEPYHFARLEAGHTNSVTADIHQGDLDDGACIAQGADSNLDVDPQSLCEFDYSFDSDSNDDRFIGSEYNCDEGEFSYQLETYTAFESCDCSNQNGTSDPGGNCPDGDPFSESSCGACDNAAITNKSQCEETDNWTASNSQNDCSVETTNEEHSCSGAVSSCIEGAGKEILTKDQLFELFSLISSTKDNTQVNMNFNSPESLGYKSNRHLANFINHPTCHGPTNFFYDYDALDSNFRTRALSAIDDKDNESNQVITESFTGRPFYSFHCLDSSDNVQARIRLIVRDWNRPFRASSDIDHIDPDAEQTETNRLMDLTVFGDPDVNLGFQTNKFIDQEGKNFTGGSCATLGNEWPDDVDVDSRQGPPPYSTVIDGRCQDCEY